MSNESSASAFGNRVIALAVPITVALMVLAVMGLSQNIAISAKSFQEDVIAVTQMSEAELASMSINEIQDAKRTLRWAQDSEDYPVATIERELQELDVALALKLDAVVR